MTIRLNTLKMPLERAPAFLAQELEGLSPSETVPEGFFLEGPRPLIAASAYQEGYFEIQGLSSMLAGRALAPLPGERILDACAGRGGKTTHLAQLMENQGWIFGLDLSFRKLQLLQENAQRLGATIIREVCGDALMPNSFLVLHSDDELVILDHHAAHERLIFDELMGADKHTKPVCQELLIAKILTGLGFGGSGLGSALGSAARCGLSHRRIR